MALAVEPYPLSIFYILKGDNTMWPFGGRRKKELPPDNDNKQFFLPWHKAPVLSKGPLSLAAYLRIYHPSRKVSKKHQEALKNRIKNRSYAASNRRV